MAFGDEVRQAVSPDTAPMGIGGDAATIWHCDMVSDLIYELSIVDLSIVRSALGPTGTPYGVGGNATKIWHCVPGGIDKVYELSTVDFSEVRQAASPVANPSGIGGDAATIWLSCLVDDDVYELSIVDFSTVRGDNSPTLSPDGIGGTATRIWYSDRDQNSVYELSTVDFSIVRTALAPSTAPRGIGGASGTIWCCDPDSDRIYELDADVVALPTTTSDAASAVAAVTTTLNGTLDDDGGEACDCGFEWGETVAYGNTTPTQSRTTGQTFAQTISGLDPGQTYHFRAIVTNSAGTSYGADRSFTTIALSTLTTNPATGIGTAAANPNGTLDDDGGEACDCGFEWGETIAYGNTTPTQSRTTGQTFAQTISGLDPGKTYHFRAFATNDAGTSYGADRTFTTLVAASTATTDPASALAAIAATLNGTLDDDGGEACDCGFEWGLDTGYGTTTPTESKTTGETFSQVIGGLFPGTTYHFRAFAINSVGTSYGADRSFATALVISRAYALARREL